MEPDFLALAQAWVNGDPRLKELQRDDPEVVNRMAARLAEALERRRRSVAQAQPSPEGGLVVEFPRRRLNEQGQLDPEAIRELADILAKETEEPQA